MEYEVDVLLWLQYIEDKTIQLPFFIQLNSSAELRDYLVQVTTITLYSNVSCSYRHPVATWHYLGVDFSLTISIVGEWVWLLAAT